MATNSNSIYTCEFVSWLPDQEWDVEAILSQNKNLFLVKWKDWDVQYNTWEKRSNVEGWAGFQKFELERAKKLGLNLTVNEPRKMEVKNVKNKK